MKIFVNQDIKKLFCAITVILAGFVLLLQCAVRALYGDFSVLLLILSLAASCGVLFFCFRYFLKQNRLMEEAVSKIQGYLSGDTDARIECDEEGELYRLFHSVNTLAAVLNAHAENENRSKDFLRNIISDISHQLKTPLAALNIYNGLIEDEAEDGSSVKEFAVLSEQELDRIETLVQNLLKMAKLDAGSITLEMASENVADMMKDIELHFAYRAEQEQKEILLSGSDETYLLCDRDWLTEALDNIVKNALDHTGAGDTICLEWKNFSSAVQIDVRDNGCGIHPEDLHHIFKRFYRSRFSSDRQGVGLGLPMAKAIIEAHGGTIEVDSEPGRGTTFTIHFLIPTKL